MMSKQFNDFMNLPYKFLLSIGYDFQDKPKSLWLTGAMRMYLIASLLSCIYVTYYIFIETANEILEGLQNVSLFYRYLTDIIFNVIAFLKCIYFVRYLRQNKIIYEVFYEIFPKYQEERKLYRIQDFFWPIWVRVILFSYFCSVLLIIFGPIIEMSIEYAVQCFKFGRADANFGYIKVYEISYGMDHHTPLSYTLFYIIEVLNGHFATVFNICPDMLLIAYTMQLSMHFDYIARTLESFKPSLEEGAAKDCQFLAVLIKKHQLILKLSNSVKEIFSILILIMFFSTAVTLCCAGVYVISQGLSLDQLGFLAFLSTSLGQYFIVCFYGQQIINQSLNIRDAAFNSSWYDGSKSYKKHILIIMQRSQRQAQFNAGGFQITNLEAFKAVISLSYTSFTMLRTIFN